MSDAPNGEEIELAELQQALLDSATLDALLGDIDALCTIEAITFKSSAEAYADEAASTSLAAIRPALARGAAVQLRYSYRGERWCDTLLPGMTETLLVRMRERVLADPHRPGHDAGTSLAEPARDAPLPAEPGHTSGRSTDDEP